MERMAQDDGDVEVERMAQDSESAFREYLDNTFPIDGKRTRSAVIRQALAEKIARYLKGSTQSSDKIFRHFVKKSGFELLDLPSVGIRDSLVVRVKEEHKVNKTADCVENVHVHVAKVV